METAEAPGVSRGVSVEMALTVSFTVLRGASTLMLGTVLASKLVARKRLSTQIAQADASSALCWHLRD